MKLKRKLGLLETFSISAGAMISSGLFVLPALAFAKTGPSVILAYALASLLVLPAVLSKSELATAMPKTGGVFFFTNKSMGPMMGTLGGLAAWFSLAFKSAFALLGIGIFMLLISPNATMLEVRLVAIVCVLIFTAINIFGVKLAGKFQVFMVVALLVFLGLYVIAGIPFIEISNYTPFAPMGFDSIFATAALVFISFAGTTKIAAIAEEVKRPARNLPLAMILSWAAVSLLYILIISVTVGIVDPVELQNSLAPIALGGGVIMGIFGVMIMSFVAALAFITTGNAGILAASRNPMAMGKDELLPSGFGRLSKQGTPWVSILVTSGFMIAVILFLDLEEFVKTASALQLVLFILANLSLIFMRESKMKYYRPRYKAPFYPWLQVFGIVGYGFLILQMGTVPIMTVGIFAILGLAWYYIYAHGKIKREYAFLHVVKRIMGAEATNRLLDEELREILIERDEITEKQFVKLIKKCTILDFDKPPSAKVLTEKLAHIIKGHIGLDENKMFKSLLERKKDRDMMIKPGVIAPSIITHNKHKPDIILVRCKKGIKLSENYPPVNAMFVVVSSLSESHFYIHALMWLTLAAKDRNFKRKWLKAANKEDLQNVILSSLDDQNDKQL